LDGCDLASKPGEYFSLSPAEMLAVRGSVPTFTNKGRLLNAALRRLRAGATSDYLRRLPGAEPLGTALAQEWIADLSVTRKGS
jgi:hypothetical protein